MLVPDAHHGKCRALAICRAWSEQLAEVELWRDGDETDNFLGHWDDHKVTNQASCLRRQSSQDFRHPKSITCCSQTSCRPELHRSSSHLEIV